MSHSKRNTSRPVFTSHERAMAKSAWGSSSARLSRDSFLPFGSCSLCLESAVDPVACSLGDIFCRECALSNILAQKKEIKRLEKAREHEEREAADQRARQDEEAQARAVKEFELVQAGLDVGVGRRARDVSAEAGEVRRGEKRKFALDEDEVARHAEDDRAKARKAMEDEKNEKPTLPSFWVPSVTPTSNGSNKLHEVKKKAKTSPVCPSSQENSPHTYSLHTLVTISFAEEDSKDNKTKTRICPACKKALTNASKAILAKPCGHVLCRTCAGQFMKPSGSVDPHAGPEDTDDPNTVRCYVCDTDVTERPSKKSSEKKDKEKIRPGLVELKSDGTGFSAGGVNEVKKAGTAFQC